MTEHALNHKDKSIFMEKVTVPVSYVEGSYRAIQ